MTEFAYLTIPYIAKLLGLSKGNIMKRIYDGELKAERTQKAIRSRWTVKKEDLIEHLQMRVNKAQDELQLHQYRLNRVQQI